MSPSPRLRARLVAAATTLLAATGVAVATAPGVDAAPRGRVYAPGTQVSQYGAQQVIVADRTSGTYGTWARYSWNGTRWVRVNGSATAVFGRRGVVAATQRRQGTETTPAGTFSLGTAFGAGNPGTRMPYRRVTGCSWWIEDPSQGDYNRWRESCAVSGRVARNSEHLSSYVAAGLYRQAVVVSYNYAHPRRSGTGTGAGIFLHYARSYTGGCVAVNSMSELTATVRWLDPARHPVIVIKS